METCFVLTELDAISGQAGLRKLSGYLQQYSFREHPYSSTDQTATYKRTTSNAQENWDRFMETGLTPSIMAMTKEPYKWLRHAGEIQIENDHHLIEVFLYPISASKAGLSATFASSIYDAIHSFRPYSEEVIDVNVKQGFIALLLLIVASFSPLGFALKRLDGLEDLVLHLKTADIYDWLVAPTRDSVRRWQFQFVGIRAEMVDRQLVERKWSPDGIFESRTGHLIRDQIAV